VDVDPALFERVSQRLRRRLPGLPAGAAVDGWSSMHDVTPDWNALVGWAPGIDGFMCAFGFSGHGFKLAPAVGEIVADLIAGERTSIDVSALSPARFASGLLLSTSPAYSIMG
jgi:sarcosine oxidase subunit beta